MLYFTSDVHFNDMDTIINDNRPFKSTKRFDRYVIKLWNKQANKNDTIYVVGDLVDCNGPEQDSWKKSILYVRKIKAGIVLIMGNNEDRIVKYFFDNDFSKFREYCLNIGFKDVYKDLSIFLNNKEFYLTHKAINYKKDVINLFGHCHRSMGLYKPFGFNISCDLNHFRLYSEKDIEFLLKMKEEYWNKDKCLNMVMDNKE